MDITLCQSYVRQWIAKKEVLKRSQQKQLDAKAVMIQSRWRVYVARCDYVSKIMFWRTVVLALLGNIWYSTTNTVVLPLDNCSLGYYFCAILCSPVGSCTKDGAFVKTTCVCNQNPECRKRLHCLHKVCLHPYRHHFLSGCCKIQTCKEQETDVT